MRICLFSNLYPPVVSGSSTHVFYLAQELVRQGHEVAVITAQLEKDQPLLTEDKGVTLMRLPSLRLPKMEISLNFPWLNWTYNPKNKKRVRKFLQSFKPEMLHLHNHMFDLAFMAVSMKKEFKIPLVLTLHTIIEHSNGLYNSILSPADRIFLKKKVVSQCDLVISPDLIMKNYAQRAFHIQKSPIIPYGILIPQNDQQAEVVERLKRQYKLNDSKVILSLGHVHAIRDRKDLIAAMPEVLAKIPNAKLLIVGAVATQVPVRQVEKLGLEQNVIFTGPLPHSEIGALLQISEMEVHWLNQNTPENTCLGIASLEAMAAGKTIISCSNENAYGEGVLRPNENLIMVPPAQPQFLAAQIIDLLLDKQRRQRISEVARETIKTHFTWPRVTEQLVIAYRSISPSERRA